MARRKYIFILFASLLLSISFEGSAFALGISLFRSGLEIYMLPLGIFLAFVFSALSRENPLLFSVVGILAGIVPLAIVDMILSEDLLDAFVLFVLIFGFIIIPLAIVVGVLIGLLARYFKGEAA